MRQLIFLRPLGFLSLLTAIWASPAQAGVMTLSCGSGAAAYTLMLDDDRGVMTSTTGTSETNLVLRGVRRENGGVYARGYVSGRGTEFEFTYKYSAQISYLYGNGGKRTDECRVLSNS